MNVIAGELDAWFSLLDNGTDHRAKPTDLLARRPG
jgi:hypothetical protein